MDRNIQGFPTPESNLAKLKEWLHFDFDETVKRVDALKEYDAQALLTDLLPVQEILYRKGEASEDAVPVIENLGFPNLGEASAAVNILVSLLQHKAEPQEDDKNFEQN